MGIRKPRSLQSHGYRIRPLVPERESRGFEKIGVFCSIPGCFSADFVAQKPTKTRLGYKEGS